MSLFDPPPSVITQRHPARKAEAPSVGTPPSAGPAAQTSPSPAAAPRAVLHLRHAPPPISPESEDHAL